MTPCDVCGRMVRYPILSATHAGAETEAWHFHSIPVCDTCELDLILDDELGYLDSPEDEPDEENA